MCCCFLGGWSGAAGGGGSGRWDPGARGSSAPHPHRAASQGPGSSGKKSLGAARSRQPPGQGRQRWRGWEGAEACPHPLSLPRCVAGGVPGALLPLGLSLHRGLRAGLGDPSGAGAPGTLLRGHPASPGYGALSSVSEPQFPRLQGKGTTTNTTHRGAQELRNEGPPMPRRRPASPARGRVPGPRGGGRGGPERAHARRRLRGSGTRGRWREVRDTGLARSVVGLARPPAVRLNSATPGEGPARLGRPFG